MIIKNQAVRSSFISLLLMMTFVCQSQETTESVGTQIAFMSDVHLQDVYGEFEDSDYKGVLNSGNGEYVMARTMEAQLYSTRIFNENYFAFLAALDDVVERGVKYVILPGDFSDDGQLVNVSGLREILDEYSEEHGIHFFATTGNHDPVRPFAKAAYKDDFLGEGGKPQVIMSEAGLYTPTSSQENPVIITGDIEKMGYEGIITELCDYGFYPKSENVYWESPFTTYAYDNYSFALANEQAEFQYRKYAIPPYDTSMPDVSYLVEPEDGLWLLAIDANVYIPKSSAATDSENPSNYGSSSVGYDNVLTHKEHLIDWVKDVCLRADTLGKTLVVFSHYPMIEFNNDASAYIEDLLGEEKMQTHRVPQETVAQIFADAGVKLHFAGHMHINDTGVRSTANGNTLVNVQIPSLAAYIPGYKLLTVLSDGIMEVETIVLDSVPRFDELFPLYVKEHDYLTSINSSTIWDKDILTATSYYEFTSWHLRELLRLRFLENDWPVDFKEFLIASTGKDLLLHSKASQGISDDDLAQYDVWAGFDMLYDFYRLRSADKLAIDDIGQDRIDQYQKLIDAFLNNLVVGEDSFADELQNFASIFNLFLDGQPADHFLVDTKNGGVTEVNNSTAVRESMYLESSEIMIYPNPTQLDGVLTIQSNCINSPIFIFDLSGHLILTTVSDHDGNSQVSVNAIESGIYLLKVGSNAKKLIVL